MKLTFEQYLLTIGHDNDRLFSKNKIQVERLIAGVDYFRRCYDTHMNTLTALDSYNDYLKSQS